MPVLGKTTNYGCGMKQRLWVIIYCIKFLAFKISLEK